MKKTLKTVALISILILITASSFAEPLKLSRDYNLYTYLKEANREHYINPLISSMRKFILCYKGDLELLIEDVRNSLREENNLEGLKLYRVLLMSILLDVFSLDKNIRAYNLRILDLVDLDWQGKDRIVSLDLADEDPSIDFFN